MEQDSNVRRILPQSIISPKEDLVGGESQFFTSLRPNYLREYIGQSNLVENLNVFILAAKAREECLDHIIFYGPPGLGKTTLAYIIAHEMGREIIQASGPSLERPGDLMGTLTKLREGDVIFIDEIHRMPRIVQEFLYSAMEDFRVDFVLDKGPHSRTVQFKIQRFTLIGATTRKGLLTEAFQSRFGIHQHLEFYTVEELKEIILRSSTLLKIEITEDGAIEIAKRSRKTPRVANRLLRRVRDFAQVKADGVINKEVADASLKLFKVDDAGLDELDRKFLRVIISQYKGGPVGINAIAATLQEEEETIVDVVEPYLLNSGFVSRTSRGRMATEKACLHLGLPYIYPTEYPQEDLFAE